MQPGNADDAHSKNGVAAGAQSTSFRSSEYLIVNLCLSGNVREFWSSK